MVDIFKALADIYAPKAQVSTQSAQPDRPKVECQPKPVSSGLSYEAQIIEAINRHRASLSLCTLQPVIQLSEIAINHCQWMAERNTASHAGVEKRHDQAISLGFRIFNENLAGGECYTWQLPEQIQRCTPGWIASPGHKRTLEQADFTHTGIGIVIVPFSNESDRLTYFVTQTFGGI